VSFDEDRSQVRTGHGPQVMAEFRNVAITALRLSVSPASPPRYATTPATPTAHSLPTRSHDRFAGALRTL
jgi:hypothetical protein